MDSTIIDHKVILEDKQTLHASAMKNKHLNLKKVQKLVVEMRGMMVQEKNTQVHARGTSSQKVKILSLYQIGSPKN